MATGFLSPIGLIAQYIADRGAADAVYLIHTSLAGSVTPFATFSDATLTVRNPNPIVLHANRAAPFSMWAPRGMMLKMMMTDSAGNPVPGGGVDHLPGINDVAAAIYPRSAREIAAGVTPVNLQYPPGNPRRNGAAGDGVTDDTAALTQCIATNDTVTFQGGDMYGVTTITFPWNGPHHIDFNGAWIRGISPTPRNCVVSLQMEGTTITDYRVDGSFSQQYLCGTWWYNATANSQYNTVFGMRHHYFGGVQTSSGATVRAMIFGALAGKTSTGFAQSENQIYGWRTRGCQNPFYSNHANGVIQFSDPIFVCVAEEWPSVGGTPRAPWSYAKARTLESVAGAVNVQGGEIQFASPGAVYSASVLGGNFADMVIETNAPILILGNGSRFSGCSYLTGADSASAFVVDAGATGTLSLADMSFGRAVGVGAYSASPLVDASRAAPNFEVLMNDTASTEWRWSLLGADVRLIKGGMARYQNHRMQITAADPYIYYLHTSPAFSVLDGTGFDRMGYTTAGWYLTVDYGAGTTLTAAAAPGPPGRLAAQIELHATGSALASAGNPASRQTLESSALRVAPGERYWLSAWCSIAAGSNVGCGARFYDLAGTFVASVSVANSGSIPAGAWKFVEGPLAVPAAAAYMCPGIFATIARIQVTDLRVRPAG